MSRAWRRPVTDEEVNGVLGYLDVVASEPGEPEPFQQAVRLGIEDVLMSPNFLFRFELIAEPSSPAEQPLSAFDLANRLSYFIYESMPDAQLFAAAQAGTLSNPAELQAQVLRMLADPKGQALIDRLAGNWLWTNRVDLVNPKSTLYPTFDADLRASLKKETSLFVQEFLLGDRSFKDMLDADFTYVNARLAKHYNLPGADAFSTDFSRTVLSNTPERGGVLTQGAVLAATSSPSNNPLAEISETNVIVRGKFVLEHILCAALPEPPKDLDINQIQADAQKDIPDTAPRKVREGVRQTMSPCLNCHTYLDPIGFSMEHFDVTGAWRNVDLLNTAVDSTGVLKAQDGSIAGSFDGARSLGTLLKRDPRLSGCVTRTILNMAVGRTLNGDDQCRIERLSSQSDVSGNRLGDLVTSIIQTRSFTHQQGEAP
jgi:hypothetical protein